MTGADLSSACYRNKDTHTVPGGSGYMSYVPESADDAVLSLCRIRKIL